MEIVIHGTEGGNRTFIQGKHEFKEIRPDTVEGNAIGHEAYSVCFVKNKCVLSKYKIIRDVRGDKRTGFVGFSLFLVNNEKLGGKDIKNLLDEVSEKFHLIYIPNNDNNLNIIREDWSFVEAILNNYKAKLHIVSSEDAEDLLSGQKDAAYIYYKDDKELQEYFNNPFQEEYCAYSQVFFIKEELRGKPENPLNALRHSESDLTGKIDLKNTRYRLRFNKYAKSGVIIEVKANGIIRSNKDVIRKNDNLEISWSKLYYEPESKRGLASDISAQYIKVNDDVQSVYIEEIELLPEEKRVTFDIKDRKGNSITNAEVKIGSEEWKVVNGNQHTHTFIGAELGQPWTISARKDDRWILNNHSIDDLERIGTTVELRLNERKTVKFTGISKEGSERYFPDIKVTIKQKQIYDRLSEVTFENEDIDAQFEVIADYKTPQGENFRGEIKFSPRNHDNLSIELKKDLIERPKKYRIDAGGYGEKSKKCPPYSNSEYGKDVKHFIRAKSGWKFDYFKLNDAQITGDDDGVIVAHYVKDKNIFRKPEVLVGLAAILIMVIGLGIWKLTSKSPESTQLTKEIINYTEGTKLNLDTLNSYSQKWKAQEPEIAGNRGGFWKIFKKKSPDSTVFKNWAEVRDHIGDAIKKREFINSHNFAELKNLEYSDGQKTFETAINSIDSLQYGEIEVADVSSKDLNEIAKNIEDLNTKSTKTKGDNSITESTQLPIPPISGGKIVNNTDSPPSPQKGESKEQEIRTYIKGNELKKEKLEGYLREVNNNRELSKSLELCLDFWKLVKTKDQKQDFDDLFIKVKNDNLLKESTLKKVLEGICKTSESFLKYKSLPGKMLKSKLSEINS